MKHATVAGKMPTKRSTKRSAGFLKRDISSQSTEYDFRSAVHWQEKTGEMAPSSGNFSLVSVRRGYHTQLVRFWTSDRTSNFIMIEES